MANLINRQAAIDALEKAMCEDGFRSSTGLIHKTTAYEIIRHLPSAKPEIVRCKDCKWKQGSECVRFAEARPFPDDFCSRAERRTDGSDRKTNGN